MRCLRWAGAVTLLVGRMGLAQDVNAVVNRWAVGAELGLNAARGNSNYTVLSSGLRFNHINKKAFELDWTSGVTYGQSDVTVIARRLTTTFKADLHPEDTWSPFVFSSFESDRIRKLNLFANTGAGVKRLLYRSPTTKASLSLAGIYSYKSIIGGVNSTTARLSLRPKFSKKLASGFMFEQTTFYQPAVTDFPDYNIEAATRVSYAASKTSTLFAQHTYRADSRPPTGIKREDHLLVAGLKMQF